MAATDLCSLADVREHREFPVADTNLDPIIESLITRWSKAITHYTEREFAPAVSAVTRSYEINSERLLHPFPAPWDLRSATAVTLDAGTSDQQVLTASTDYRLALPDDEHATFGGVELYFTVNAVWQRWSTRRLQVVGNWGFTDVPADVSEACCLAVVMTLMQEVQSFGSALQPNSLGSGVNDAVALPPGIRGLLAPYRRITCH